MKKIDKEQIEEADRLNGRDDTDDVVYEVPTTSDAGEAVAAITSHINKFDVPDEFEKK